MVTSIVVKVVKMLCPQQILTTVMTNIFVEKSTENAEPLSIGFLPEYSEPRVYFREWPKSWHKERESLVYNFLAIWLVDFPKWARIIASLD